MYTRCQKITLVQHNLLYVYDKNIPVLHLKTSYFSININLKKQLHAKQKYKPNNILCRLGVCLKISQIKILFFLFTSLTY